MTFLKLRYLAAILIVASHLIILLTSNTIRSGFFFASLACKLFSTAEDRDLYKLTACIEVLTEYNTLVNFMQINSMQR